jgi:hypothetical protein
MFKKYVLSFVLVLFFVVSFDTMVFNGGEPPVQPTQQQYENKNFSPFIVIESQPALPYPAPPTNPEILLEIIYESVSDLPSDGDISYVWENQ